MQMKKSSHILFWILFVVYAVNVLSKSAFAAVTVALVNESILTKTEAGAINGCFWIIYAAGQLLGGFMANKYSPYKMLFVSIIGSAVFNVLMAFGNSFSYMMTIWCLNGLFQFGMWPCIIKLMSVEIIPEHRAKAASYMTYCYCVGMIFSYAITSLSLSISTWEGVFYACGVLNVITLIPAIYAMVKLSPALKTQIEEPVQNVEVKKGKLTPKIVFASGIIVFAMLLIIKSVVEFGAKNWMPTILTETYGADPSFTSFLSMIAMVLNIPGMLLCNILYNKLGGDEAKCVGIMFACALPTTLILFMLDKINIYVAATAFTFMGLTTHGASQTMLVKYSSRFGKLGLVSVMGGITNCFSAVGNFAAAYVCGFVADNFGWDTMIVWWNIIVVLAIVLAAAIIPSWRKFKKENA